MVEPSRDYFASRTSTPTPVPIRSRFGSGGRRFRREQQEHPIVRSTSPSGTVLNSASRPFSAQSEFRTTAFRTPIEISASPMASAHGNTLIPPSPPPDASAPGTADQAHSIPHSGQPVYFSTLPPPSNVLPPRGSSDNIHTIGHQHSAPHVYYSGAYNSSAYTLSPQTISNTVQNPSPPGYASFRSPRVAEGGVTAQNPHVHFQTMLQPHAPVYYQPHPSAPVRSHFLPMHYPSAPPSQFSYPPRSFHTSPPIYQSYASHHPYTSHEVDTRGAWYYLPHNTQPHSERDPTFQSQYSHYPPITSPDLENPAPAPQDHSAYRPLETLEPTRPPARPSSFPPSSSGNPHVSHTGSGDGDTTGSTNQRQEKSVIRKPYHPNSPPHRSEWVMWVGNIPSDATHDELWKFFNQTPILDSPAEGSSSAQQPLSPADQRRATGVVSIFLISKSSCVFVNYETEEHLARAIDRFNGQPLRPLDPRCLRLVCRVRKREDDLKAGVGGQRGQGLHGKWIKERKLKARQAQSDVLATSHSQAPGSSHSDIVGQLTAHMSDTTLSSDDEDKGDVYESHRSSSGSFASTDSSLLSNFFPKRYFILKSLTQYDLDLSVQHGLWATQKHNEGVLDQAYRTSKDVYLIFGVNKSGEFYGYARMAGPVQHGAKNVLWASRTKDAANVTRHASQTGSLDPTPQSTPPIQAATYISPGVTLGASEDDENWSSARTPGPGQGLNSAPAELGKSHRQTSTRNHPTKSATFPSQEPSFDLDPRELIHPIRSGATPREISTSDPSEEHVQDSDIVGYGDSQPGVADTWGDCFRVEWLCTERLPFYWTRNLRNPWNHDREVKISRDGTELEPIVGAMLLNAWEAMKAAGGEIPVSSGSGGVAVRKGGQVRREPGGGER